MGFKRKLSEEHKRKISDGLRRAWARVPISKEEELYLNINYNKNNKDNFKAYLDDGTEIKRKL